MTPGTSWLWILPTNRKKSVAFLNLFCGGFLLLDSATPLLVRVSKLQDAGPSEEDIAHMAEHFLLSSFMYVPCRAKRRCHCQYQSSPSTVWNPWGNTGHHFSCVKLVETSTGANTALLTVEHPLLLPWQAIPCRCHSFHCASMRACTAESWLSVGNWSNWKLIF